MFKNKEYEERIQDLIKQLNKRSDQLAEAYMYILNLISDLKDNDKKYIKIEPFIGEMNFYNFIGVNEAVLKKDKYYEINDNYKNKKKEEELIDIYKFYNKEEIFNYE